MGKYTEQAKVAAVEDYCTCHHGLKIAATRAREQVLKALGDADMELGRYRFGGSVPILGECRHFVSRRHADHPT